MFYQKSLKEVQIKCLANTATTNQNVRLLMHSPLLPRRHRFFKLTHNLNVSLTDLEQCSQVLVVVCTVLASRNRAEVKLEANLGAWRGCGAALCGRHPELGARWVHSIATFGRTFPSFALFHWTRAAKCQWRSGVKRQVAPFKCYLQFIANLVNVNEFRSQFCLWAIWRYLLYRTVWYEALFHIQVV